MVVVNDGPTEARVESRLGGSVLLPPWGFVIEGPKFAAFHARRWNGRDYPEGALFTLQPVGDETLIHADRVRVFHGFGDPRIDWRRLEPMRVHRERRLQIIVPGQKCSEEYDPCFDQIVTIAVVLALTLGRAHAAEPLKVGVFAVDASPPIGSPMAYDPTKGVAHPLSCRGVVLIGAGRPVVLCAVDWIGIANDGQLEFRKALAAAAGTDPERVVVHTLHQHDAPVCDFSTDRLLAKQGINRAIFDADFDRDVIARAAVAVRTATTQARRVTHLGLGQAEVKKVASNRRILGPDGKVQHVRWTACTEPEVRAMPVGTIDPLLKMISFWDGTEPVAVLTYYATHPQSYYRTGLANPDFPGMARDQRQEATKVPHIHFNGAGGNIGAGKWNDGAPENRQVLADRVAVGMAKAWANTVKSPINAVDVVLGIASCCPAARTASRREAT